MFSSLSHSSTIACSGYLTSNQNVLIYTAHIKKAIAKLYFLILRSENNNRSEISQKSQISLDTGTKTRDLKSENETETRDFKICVFCQNFSKKCCHHFSADFFEFLAISHLFWLQQLQALAFRRAF